MSPKALKALAPFIGIALAVVFMAFRLSKGFPPRPLRMTLMWIPPVLLLFGMTVILVRWPPSLIDGLWISLATAAGAGLGWQRGRMMNITLDAQSGRPVAQSSPAAIIFVMALMAGRTLLKAAGEGQAAAWHVNSLLITDIFMGFALGLLTAQRVEMWIRARALIAGKRDIGQTVS
ncbi:MAG: DUF1453 family protein [Caulobacteraceae bacterium]|nr:DUF1453 family protein [Caulobacteraceae bacterium]